MQIARGPFGPLSRRPLRLRDRWSVMDAALNWIFAYTFRIAALVAPLLYWYFNILVVDAEVTDVISYFGAYYLFVVCAMNFISAGRIIPLLADVSQTLGAIPITRAAYVGLFKPKGHPFRVTAKGGDRRRVVVQWALMRPYLVLFALTAVGLALGLFSWRFEFAAAGDGKVVTLFWTVYNVFVLGLTILACIELPRTDRPVGDRPERVTVEGLGPAPAPVWMRGLTVGGARLRGVELAPGHPLLLTLERPDRAPGDDGTDRTARGDGSAAATRPGYRHRPDLAAEPPLRLAATVTRCEAGSVVVRFEHDEATRTALLRRLHAEGGAPNVMRPRPFGVVGDVLIRLATGRP
jgi:cellulose synthase (UDP-forming)